MTSITPTELADAVAKIAALDEKRMPGTWAIQYSYEDGHRIGPERCTTIATARNGADDDEYGGKEGELANAAFIATAPLMAQVIRQLWAEREAIKTALETAKLFVLKHPNDIMAVPVIRVIDEAFAMAARPQPAPAAGVVELRGLVARGLNLCAQGRNLNKKIDEAPPQHCATPYVWAQEQYEEQLAQWERDASNTLAALPAPSVGEDEAVEIMLPVIGNFVYGTHPRDKAKEIYRALIAAGVIRGV